MKTSAVVRQIRFATLTVASALLLVGCGSESTLTPQTGGLPGSPIYLPASEMAALLPLGTNAMTPSVEATVSASEGGTLKLGRMTLSFPPGALAEDTRITMSLTDRKSLRVELLPHGIHFQKPVTLSADLTGLLNPTTRTVGVAWLNDATGYWEAISRGPASSGMASAQLHHFSNYDLFGE